MIDLTTLPLDVTNHVMKFRNFLNVCWASVDNLMETHDWDNDGDFLTNWMQVNWEFFMERELLGPDRFIFPIQCSRRITFPASRPTHKIICKYNQAIELRDQISKTFNYDGEELLLDGFCSKYESSFGLYPPFDFIDARTLDKKRLYTIPLLNCQFFLCVF